MLCVSSFPVVAAAVVVLSILSCRQDVAACVVLTVVLSKTAVPSQHLRRVVVAASVPGRSEGYSSCLVSGSCRSWRGVRPVFYRGWPLTGNVTGNVCRCRRGCACLPTSAASCRRQRCRGSGCLFSSASLCGNSLWPLVCFSVPLFGTPVASGRT